MADGYNRPATPAAGGLGPRIAACALVVGVGVLVALLLVPGVGRKAAAGDDKGTTTSSPRPSATKSNEGLDGFRDRLPSKQRSAALDDVEKMRLHVDGVSRKALVYVPEDVPDDAPVFVTAHGYTSSARAMIKRTSYIDLAQRNGWILAFPQGLEYSNGQHAWNAGDCCGGAPDAGTADVEFVSTLADELVDRYDADPKRLFFHGYSNGAMLGYRVACEADQPFDGFALLSGTLVSECGSTARVPLLAVHGLRDGTVPFAGSRWRVSLQTELPPVKESVNKIASLNGCRGQLDSDAPRRKQVRSYTAPCPEGTEVELVTVATMEHQWTEDTDRYGIDETRFSTRWLLGHA